MELDIKEYGNLYTRSGIYNSKYEITQLSSQICLCHLQLRGYCQNYLLMHCENFSSVSVSKVVRDFEMNFLYLTVKAV